MKRKPEPTPEPVHLDRLVTRINELAHETAAVRVVVSQSIEDSTPPDAAIRGVPSLLLNIQAGLKAMADEAWERNVK